MWSIFSTLFSRLQQRCGLSLSVLQQLIRIGNALLCSRNVTSDLVAGLDHESCTVEECVNSIRPYFLLGLPFLLPTSTIFPIPLSSE